MGLEPLRQQLQGTTHVPLVAIARAQDPYTRSTIK